MSTIDLPTYVEQRLDQLNEIYFDSKLTYGQLVGWLATKGVVENENADVTLGGDIIVTDDETPDVEGFDGE